MELECSKCGVKTFTVEVNLLDSGKMQAKIFCSECQNLEKELFDVVEGDEVKLVDLDDAEWEGDDVTSIGN